MTRNSSSLLAPMLKRRRYNRTTTPRKKKGIAVLAVTKEKLEQMAGGTHALNETLERIIKRYAPTFSLPADWRLSLKKARAVEAAKSFDARTPQKGLGSSYDAASRELLQAVQARTGGSYPAILKGMIDLAYTEMFPERSEAEVVAKTKQHRMPRRDRTPEEIDAEIIAEFGPGALDAPSII